MRTQGTQHLGPSNKGKGVLSIYAGNWSPSDFPSGSTFTPYSHSKLSVNRDLLVSMEGEDIVGAFKTVFDHDWLSGTDWAPK